MSRQPVGSIALPAWQRRAIYVSGALLLASGLGWVLVAWPAGTEMSAAARTAATWLLRLHGVCAYAVLVIVGTVLPVHLRLGWTKKRNRWSGSLLVGLLACLALTGLWLYYGPESGREIVSNGHWWLGLVLPVWLLLHRAWGLRSRRANASDARRS